jgi:hypothetical protein
LTDYYTRPATGRSLLAGAAAALAGAAVWAIIAYLTGYQLAILAITTGMTTGVAVTRAALSPPAALRAAAAALAVAGCALGTLLAMMAILAGRHGIGPGVIIGHLGTVLSAYPGEVGRDGLLFWAVAAAAAAFPPRLPGRGAPGRHAAPRLRQGHVTDLRGSAGPGAAQPRPRPRAGATRPPGFTAFPAPGTGYPAAACA